MYHSSAPCCPPSYHSCCHHHAGGAYAWPAMVAYVPVYWPSAAPWAAASHAMTLTEELYADKTTTPKSALIGGTSDAHLSVESFVESGAAAPAVKVTVTSDGTTSTWSDTSIAPGYHVKESFITVKPGSKVVLDVTDAVARLRWCETICC
jgi:hypothetical protein